MTTTIMTNLVTNVTAASILTPIALGIAADVRMNPVCLATAIGVTGAILTYR
jgi:hypothetical protein